MSLIEVLVSVLIFSVGLLGIVGMQAAAAKASTNAKYRSDAALLANEIIGKMWVSDRTQATLQAAFTGNDATHTIPDGASYLQWAWAGTTSGTQTSPADGTVLKTLPGASDHPPTIVVSQVAPGVATSLPNSLVTVTIYWKAPNETTEHNHVAIAQIGG